MNTKHTPGPWSRNIKPAAKYCTIFAGRNTHVAHLANGLPDDEIEANCNLIAAAPELLEALSALASTARTFRNVPKDEQEWTSIDEDALIAAFAIIAKATSD
jgi:hypothetical protein